VTSPASTEIKHIAKIFRLGYDYVILSFISSREMEKAKRLAKDQYSDEELMKVCFCLVNSISRVLQKMCDA